jgi:DNA-binding CsgD family transcriptional regulator
MSKDSFERARKDFFESSNASSTPPAQKPKPQQALDSKVRANVLEEDEPQTMLTAVTQHLIQVTPARKTAVQPLVRSGSPQRVKTPWLSRREIEITRLLCDGKSSQDIACVLGISARTVASHRSNILRRLHLNSTALLIRWSIRNGVIEP